MIHWPVSLLLAVGLVSNLFAIWQLDRSEGMTKLLPALVVAITVVFSQKCYATIVHQDRLRRTAAVDASHDGRGEAAEASATGGWSLGVTLGTVLVALLIGSAAIGYFLGDDPAPSLRQCVGYAVAVVGIVLLKFGG